VPTQWIAAAVLGSIVALGGTLVSTAAASPPAVTPSVATITNTAAGTYDDAQGRVYGSVSAQATVAVAAVSAAMLSPKEVSANPIGDAVADGTVATRTFTITNDSNITDAYVISAVTVGAGTVKSVAFMPVSAASIVAVVGTTVSPSVLPGGSLSVAVSVSINGLPIGANIEVSLSVKTTAASANGPQSDTGTAWIVVAPGPALGGVAPANGAPPAGGGSPTALPIAVFVDGGGMSQTQPGATLGFQLGFVNEGGSPAFGVVVTNQIPQQLQPIAGSAVLTSTGQAMAAGAHVALNGNTLTTPIAGARIALNGNTLTTTIPELDPGVAVSITFQATTGVSVPIGTVISDSSIITAQSLAKILSSPAIVFVGSMGLVYDALSGSAHPIAAAQISIADPVSGLPAKLATRGTTPNAADANPFSTGSSGTFSFVLLSTAGRATDYDLYVTNVPGYVNRKIAVAVVTDYAGSPTTKLTALDGMPLAVAGSFGLTATPVSVTGVTGFFGNVPLFSTQILALSAAVDRTLASAGDRLGYTIDFGPGNRTPPGTAQLTVVLPAGVAYARGSARVGVVPVEPTKLNGSLVWPLKNLVASGRLTFAALVLPGVSAGTTVTTVAHLGVVISGAPFGIDASVGVSVVAGLLSARTIITGRVFADHAGGGHFGPGDAGLSDVRIFLEDGESVQTDRDGRFSFPAARPGMHVLRIDPITLPAGMHVYRGFAVDDARSSIRLVHGIFDSDLMHDINFAISEGPGR